MLWPSKGPFYGRDGKSTDKRDFLHCSTNYSSPAKFRVKRQIISGTVGGSTDVYRWTILAVCRWLRRRWREASLRPIVISGTTDRCRHYHRLVVIIDVIVIFVTFVSTAPDIVVMIVCCRHQMSFSDSWPYNYFIPVLWKIQIENDWNECWRLLFCEFELNEFECLILCFCGLL